MARLLLLIVCFGPLAASAADDPRVAILEQEVRNLQRQVQGLSRRIDEISTRPDRPTSRPSTAVTAASAAAAPQWVDATRWRELRRGMSEIEVIGSLGPPTSMREESGAHVLLYALEIGGGAFLGGSVILRNGAVADVRQPTLQ